MHKIALSALAAACLLAGPALAADPPPDKPAPFTEEAANSEGSVSVEGVKVAYKAVAGTLIVHPRGWDDAAAKTLNDKTADKLDKDLGAGGGAEASMFYTAYFKKGATPTQRPIVFLYNGGPGSATVWLHMGAFGPKRVVTRDAAYTPAAPYGLTENAYSLLDVADLVFIDAPGAGFSRIAGKDKEKAFWGVDQDAHAFEQFILQFLSKYDRWNSPKYLFGESYGTPRSAVVAAHLTIEHSVDLNGVILLSQILNFGLDVDGPLASPGSDEPYIVALPTYAATAWYHHRVGSDRPDDLKAFLKEAEAFATGEYASALLQGSELDPARKQAVAEKLSHFIGLPVPYLLKADLRVSGGMFEKTLQDDLGITTGRLDTRFTGPDIDRLSKTSDYDPQSAAISSAYISVFNAYARDTLGYGAGKIFKPFAGFDRPWDFTHKPISDDGAFPGALNVMPDIAAAMKFNPNLKVMVAGGYYDLATPYYEGWYEMHHLPISAQQQANIEFHYYPAGHMVFVNEASLKALHDDTAAFIKATSKAQ
jgi:carboxypeptidase C (cathepsin A)